LSARELPARIARECKRLTRDTGPTKRMSRQGDYTPEADLIRAKLPRTPFLYSIGDYTLGWITPVLPTFLD
jgi:hypothetical protein